MFRIRIVKDFPGIGSIKTMKVERYATSLLGGIQADVTFTYSNKKVILISGDDKDVYQESLKRISLIKNPLKAKQMAEIFNEQYRRTDVQPRARLGKGLNKFIEEKYYNPFSVGEPKNLLNDALKERDMSAKDLANKMRTEQKESTTYTHTSGSRAISREVAIKYSEILKCDPVDLMFNKVTIPVWGKVNVMHNVELEKIYEAGEIYSYATTVADTEIAIVPRDLWRSDIKAIKVDAKGTMYHNQVAFYYYKQGNDDAALNKLCIVGMKVYPNADFDPDFYETQYYFGVYENIRGVSNLVNPDPYVKEKNKIILEDFTPTFVAPIVAMVNTDAVIDDTDKVQSIPQSEWRKEESLRIEKAILQKRLNDQDISEKEYEVKYLKIKENIKSHEALLAKQIEIQTARIEAMHKAQNSVRDELFKTQQQRKFKNFFKKDTDKKLA